MKDKFVKFGILPAVIICFLGVHFAGECSQSADISDKHPIDIKIQKCIEECDYATACSAGCINSSDVEWQKEIKNNIAKLKNIMKDNEFYYLQKSQFEWDKYRKAQEKLDEKTLGKLMGSVYLVVLASRRIEVLSNRAKELEVMYRYLSDR